MFPLSDDNPTLRSSVITIAIIVANLAVWVLVQGMGAEPALGRSLCLYGLIPADLLGLAPVGSRVPLTATSACVLGGSPTWYTPLSSMFMHGGWFHIVGNLWFLWIFGNNVEDAMGRARYLLFYLLCGLAAAAAQTLASPSSAMPMVGASGAIGGVMGAYAVLYPRARINTLLFLGFYVTTIAVPAYLMLGYWFLIQLISGIPSVGATGGGVAFWAHVGGFSAGALLILAFRNPQLLAAQCRIAGRSQRGRHHA